jgi:hypothetical protein
VHVHARKVADRTKDIDESFGVVLWRETSAVLRMSSRVVDARPPVVSEDPGPSGFMDGPATWRTESLDFDVAYAGVLQAAPLQVTGGSGGSSRAAAASRRTW